MSRDYVQSEAERMFWKLGYTKYESKFLNSIMYKNKAHQIVFMLEQQRFYASIDESDINFNKYRPMEIDFDEYECIAKQIEELGWKGKSRE